MLSERTLGNKATEDADWLGPPDKKILDGKNPDERMLVEKTLARAMLDNIMTVDIILGQLGMPDDMSPVDSIMDSVRGATEDCFYGRHPC